MDFGRPIQFGYFVLPDSMRPLRPLQLAIRAEELGIDVIGIQDHPYQRRFYDTWTLLTAIAMRTNRVSVFPDVANLPLRPPAMLAKAAASLDVLSGGRVELGLGAGAFWEAIEAMGGSRRSPADAVAALEEAIAVIRLMWSDERSVRFDGRHYRLGRERAALVLAGRAGSLYRARDDGVRVLARLGPRAPVRGLRPRGRPGREGRAHDLTSSTQASAHAATARITDSRSRPFAVRWYST